MSEPDTTTPAPSPALLTVDAIRAADLLGIGRSTWLQMHKDGRCPAGVKLGRCRRWMVEELRAWVIAGCPPRHRWTWPRPEDPR